MPPQSAPKKRKVHLPENEEVAGMLLEKHLSMAAEEQPGGGLSGKQGLELSAAYRGVCAAKQPIRTPRDLLRTRGVEDWVFNLMKDSFPSSVPDLSPQEVASPIEASGLSESAIGPNNTRAKPGNPQNDWYTGWSCINTLVSKNLVEKWSSPAKYMLTEEGEKAARDCLERSGLDGAAGPSAHPSEEVILRDSDSDEPYEVCNPLIGFIGSENFAEGSGPPKSKADSSSSFNISKGPAINAPLSSRGMFAQQSLSAMMAPFLCYVVYIGRVPGVYERWQDCHMQVNGFPGNRYKGYMSRALAEENWRNHLRQQNRTRTRTNFIVTTTTFFFVVACVFYFFTSRA